VNIFGWMALGPDVPERWNLRLGGWKSCGGELSESVAEGFINCRHVLLADVRGFEPAARLAAGRNGSRRRLSAGNHPAVHADRAG
jgi:hypothetical protein